MPGAGESAFLDTLWAAIDEVCQRPLSSQEHRVCKHEARLHAQAMTLDECDVYSYKGDGEIDPFGKVHYAIQGLQLRAASQEGDTLQVMSMSLLC